MERELVVDAVMLVRHVLNEVAAGLHGGNAEEEEVFGVALHRCVGKHLRLAGNLRTALLGILVHAAYGIRLRGGDDGDQAKEGEPLGFTLRSRANDLAIGGVESKHAGSGVLTAKMLGVL